MSGGKHEKQSFDAEFKRLPQKKVQELVSESIAENTDSVFCKEVMVGWKGIQDDDKKEVPFSQEALDELLEVPKMATSIVQAYMASIAGSKIKN
jgi:hypothetical protein